MCKHYDCQYYSPATGSCDYILFTGHSRGCPATDDCYRHCIDPKKVESVVVGRKRRQVNLAGIRRLEKEYKAKFTTRELAVVARVDPEEALLWRRKVHPESIVFENSKSTKRKHRR